MMDRDYRYPDTTGATPESEPCVQEQERCQTVDEQQAAGCTGAQTEPCAPEDASPGVEPPSSGRRPTGSSRGDGSFSPRASRPGTGSFGAPATEAGDLEKLDETIQALTLERDEWKAKAEDYWDRYLRAMSEMDNFRKRTERDIHRRVERGKSELILPLLDVLDNFDRALAAGGAKRQGRPRRRVQGVLRRSGADTAANSGCTCQGRRTTYRGPCRQDVRSQVPRGCGCPGGRRGAWYHNPGTSEGIHVQRSGPQA